MLYYIVSAAPLKGEQSLSDVKNMIHKLFTSLNVDAHQVTRWGVVCGRGHKRIGLRVHNCLQYVRVYSCFYSFIIM